MTAISVGIQKIEETIEWVKYAFGGHLVKILGRVIFQKSNEKVELLDIVDDIYKKYTLPCVIKTLVECYKHGEYLDVTIFNS